jgi:hypothetical protein
VAEIAVSSLFCILLTLLVAEKVDLPNNTKCEIAQNISLSEGVLYSKNTVRDVSRFECYGRNITMVFHILSIPHFFQAGVWYYYEADDDKIIEINTCFSHNNLLTHVFVFQDNCTTECILWGEGNEGIPSEIGYSPGSLSESSNYRV